MTLERISIIGTGNVANHLATWLTNRGLKIDQVNSRTLESLDPQSDIYIISVTDSAIREVAEKVDALIENNDAIIAHTSGSTPVTVLSGLNHYSGVIYPMQTFTTGRELRYEDIPVFIEGTSNEAKEKLMQLAAGISSSPSMVDSQMRAHIHLGAVFACNFLNYMLSLAEKSIQPCGIDMNIYLPLVQETVNKAFAIGPDNAQTGAARRGDLETMWTHMSLLNSHQHMNRIYRMLSQQILNKYK